MSYAITCGARSLDLSTPRIMGILNVTPDSFSDGGQLYQDGRVQIDAVLRRAEEMCSSGAEILDVGGESTRPGAAPVAESEESDRVLTAVEAIVSRIDVIVSVDTSTPSIMTASGKLGAGLLNDVRGFRRPGALESAAGSGLAMCLMHMQGEPDTMQHDPSYDNVITDLDVFFDAQLDRLQAAGVPRDRIIIDPGFGFGKTAQQNFEMLARLSELAAKRVPVLVGLSRKSMISSVLDRPPEARVLASVGLAMMAVERGARIVRVHDVAATSDALTMWRAVSQVKSS